MTSPTRRAAPIIERAGADLAVINRIPVDGFGFIRKRDSRWPLHAEHSRYEDFVVSYLPQPWPGPLAPLFGHAGVRALEALIEQERTSPRTQAVLSHGDFDTTQIFCADGHYTGLIDFGEIRGTDPFFDLSHFHLWDEVGGLPALLRGYQQTQPLPLGHETTIHNGAILLGLRQLCRWLGPPMRRPLDDPAVVDRAQRIRHLITRSDLPG